MGSGVRPDPTDLTALIAERRAALMKETDAPPGDMAALIAERRAALAGESKSPLGERVIRNIGGAIQQTVAHPIDTARGIIEAPVKSLINAMAPGVGEARHSAALSKGGNSSGRPIDTTTYDAEHGGVTGKERLAGAAQTITNIALPGIAGGVAGKLGGGTLAKAAGLASAGGASGAAYTPDDPIAGGMAGAIMAPALAAAGKGVGKLAGKAGSSIVDFAGRPMESQPAIQAGPVKVGRIEGIADRAARLNAQGLERPGFFSAVKPDFAPNDKPLAPVDMHISAQRMARGLKTSSAGAEHEMRSALEPRAEGAVDRVISHGLETTGLKTRASGLQTVDDLIAQRAQHGTENFQPVFEQHQAPVDAPAFRDILQTPAGKQALKRGMTIAANRGEKVNSTPLGGGVPDGYTPEQWERITTTMRERGMPVPEVPTGETVVTPTLKQAHYIKLGFDDMLNSAPEPGSGGSGPNNAAAIRTLKNRWLAAMDVAAPEYGKARKVFADESDLIRAGETGRALFKMHPDEAAKAFKEMSAAERDVARRTGFDALAERVENGPENVGKGIKVRDQKRMRLLFPDDQSFAAFQEGLKQEAQMHATKQGVLSGSNTADKLADMAGMAGVTLPEVLHAATGRIMPLVHGVAGRTIRAMGNASSERVNVERAKLLTAGASGNAGERALALKKMGAHRKMPAGALMAAVQGPASLPDALDSRTGPDLYPPSNAAQAVRQQVDALNQKQTIRAHHKPKF